MVTIIWLNNREVKEKFIEFSKRYEVYEYRVHKLVNIKIDFLPNTFDDDAGLERP